MSRSAPLFVLGLFAAGAGQTFGQFTPIYGGVTFDPNTTTGYRNATEQVLPGQSAGNGIGICRVGYTAGTASGLGNRAVRFGSTGAPTVLGNLNTNTGGTTNSTPYAINFSGTVVGTGQRYSGTTSLGVRAVRWDAGQATATELGNLGFDSSNLSTSAAYAINDSGTTTGNATKYVGGTSLGTRAVRWAAGGTAVTELGDIGLSSTNSTQARGYAINVGGTVVGSASKYAGSTQVGDRAVRWDAGQTAATELGHLGLSAAGVTSATAWAVNDSGTAAGIADKYVGGVSVGDRAVRWDAGQTTATELGGLGAAADGSTYGRAYDINTAGTAVGYAEKYSAANADLGSRATRWVAGATAAVELGGLANAVSNSLAYAINDGGLVAGVVSDAALGDRAVFWQNDGTAVDLNTLIDPSLGWTLTEARGISDTNWVTGLGKFDPDGSGPTVSYTRAFLIQVPEPASLAAFGVAGLLLVRRRR